MFDAERSARRRIERSAELLDELQPGWHERIDVEALDMGSCSHCMVGQLTCPEDKTLTEWEHFLNGNTNGEPLPSFGALIYRLGFDGPDNPRLSQAIELGFEFDDLEAGYDVLYGLWVNEINERLVFPTRWGSMDTVP